MANFVLLQFDPQTRTVKENADYIYRRASEHQDALVILPELFLSSYSKYRFLDSEDLPAILKSLIDLGKQKHLAFIGSLPVQVKNKKFNRGVYINGEHILTKDKKELFGEEKETLTPGCANPLFYYKNIAFSLQVCLDIIDPLPSHFAVQKGAQLIINSATVSVDFLRTINKARALENDVVSVFCNRSGSEANGIQYLGKSGVFFADGIEKNIQETEETITFTL